MSPGEGDTPSLEFQRVPSYVSGVGVSSRVSDSYDGRFAAGSHG